MSYFKDLSKISISQYRDRLKKARLLPSQKILLEEIDSRFSIIEYQNIANIEELFQIIKTKSKVQKFAEVTGLPLDYVTILRREINSHQPTPRKWIEFKTLSRQTIDKLEKMRILNTQDIFQYILTDEKRDLFFQKSDISNPEILLLAKLSDLCRLRYVNYTFAIVLTKTEFDCVEKIQQAKAEDIYQDVLLANENNQFYKGKIGIKDMQFLIDDSLELDIELQL